MPITLPKWHWMLCFSLRKASAKKSTSQKSPSCAVQARTPKGRWRYPRKRTILMLLPTSSARFCALAWMITPSPKSISSSPITCETLRRLTQVGSLASVPRAVRAWGWMVPRSGSSLIPSHQSVRAPLNPTRAARSSPPFKPPHVCVCVC